MPGLHVQKSSTKNILWNVWHAWWVFTTRSNQFSYKPVRYKSFTVMTSFYHVRFLLAIFSVLYCSVFAFLSWMFLKADLNCYAHILFNMSFWHASFSWMLLLPGWVVLVQGKKRLLRISLMRNRKFRLYKPFKYNYPCWLMIDNTRQKCFWSIYNNHGWLKMIYLFRSYNI